jgi:hypothetical protein
VFQDAVFRAAQFESGAAKVLRARADHYEALIAPASITDIRANRRPGHVLIYEEPTEVLELNPAAALQVLMDYVESMAAHMASS